MDIEKLKQQIKLEQVRYLYVQNIPAQQIALVFSNDHIPPEYIFNQKRRRTKGKQFTNVYLYCRPFFVWYNGKKYFSHIKNGKLVYESLPLKKETEIMLLDLVKTIIAKTKNKDPRYSYDLFADVYCALLLKFREVDTNRSARDIFNWLITTGINAIKNINKRTYNKWNYYEKDLGNDKKRIEQF